MSTTLTVLPPPTVRCKQMTVSGRHLAILKGRAVTSSSPIQCADLMSHCSIQPHGSTVLPLSRLSDERLLSGGGEHTGHSNFTKPQCLLPSHDARWLCAAGGQCVVCKLLHHVNSAFFVATSCHTLGCLAGPATYCSTQFLQSVVLLCTRVSMCCFLCLSTAISLVRLAWGLSAGWTAWLDAFLACSVLWRSMTSCSSSTSMTSLRMIPTRSMSFS